MKINKYVHLWLGALPSMQYQKDVNSQSKINNQYHTEYLTRLPVHQFVFITCNCYKIKQYERVRDQEKRGERRGRGGRGEGEE